jgi:hypothetical protein
MQRSLEINMSGNRFPMCVIIAASAQTLVAFTCLSVRGAFACWGVFPNSLILSSIMFGPFLIVSIISTLGLWRGKTYGWFTGVFGDGVICLMLFFVAHPWYFSALPLAVIALLLISKVRKFFFPTYPDGGLSIIR